MRILGLLILVAIAGCKKKDAAPAATPEPPLVTISSAETRGVTQYIETQGRTRSFASVEVRARVLGFLEEMRYEIGTVVEKGDVLFVIQKAEYQAQVEREKANVAAAEAEEERAKSDLERFTEALKANAVSKVQVTQAKANLLKAEASILGAKAALQRAELDLSYCEVRSPIQGLVSRNLVDVGNLVGPNQPDAALLTTVVANQPMLCYFEIPEKFVNEALRRRKARTEAEAKGERPETVVEIALQDETDYKHKGIIDWVDNKVDTATGTLRARGTFKNESKFLYSGVYVRVRTIIGTKDDAVLVKESALGMDLGGRFVLVVGGKDVVERRGVKLGQLEGNMRVILEGIKAGERYVSDGILRARPGLPVREGKPAGTQ